LGLESRDRLAVQILPHSFWHCLLIELLECIVHTGMHGGVFLAERELQRIQLVIVKGESDIYFFHVVPPQS
jgi:hypothetical protein